MEPLLEQLEQVLDLETFPHPFPKLGGVLGVDSPFFSRHFFPLVPGGKNWILDSDWLEAAPKKNMTAQFPAGET